MICTMWVEYPDGREFYNRGVQPHINAELSLNDYINGHDIVLKKGLSELRRLIHTVR